MFAVLQVSMMQVCLTAMKGQTVQELTKKENPNIFKQEFQIVTHFPITSKIECFTDRKTLKLQMLQARNNISGRFAENIQSLVS